MNLDDEIKDEIDRDLICFIENINNNLEIISQNNKKNTLAIDLLNKENFKLKNEIQKKQDNEINIYQGMILILDELYNLYNICTQLENTELLNHLDVTNKIITKQINERELIEIKALGELFTPEFHKCIAVEENTNYKSKEIISVIQRGYMLRGKLLRPSLVIIAK